MIFSVFKDFSENFCKYIRIQNSNYKDENFERKCINIMRKNQFLKVKNSLLELKIFFFELKDRKLKNREVKIK